MGRGEGEGRHRRPRRPRRTMLDRMLAANPDRAEQRRDGDDLLRVGQAARGEAAVGRRRRRVLEGAGPRSEGRARRPTRSPRTTSRSARRSRPQGKDGGPDFRRAIALKPDYAPAKTAAARSRRGGARPTWMLYAARRRGGCAALALFAAAMVRRRGVIPPRERLIVIEGLDGAGTTTQAQRLVASPRARAASRAPHARAERRADRQADPRDADRRPRDRRRRRSRRARSACCSRPIASITCSARSSRSSPPARLVVSRSLVPLVARVPGHRRRSRLDRAAQRARAPPGPDDLPAGAARGRGRSAASPPGASQELFEDLTMQHEVDAGYKATIAGAARAGRAHRDPRRRSVGRRPCSSASSR